MNSAWQHEKAIERVRLELGARELMVRILTITGVWVGVMMCLYGAPDFLEDASSPWSRYLIGGTVFVFGMVTSVASVLGDESRPGWWGQVIGLSGLAGWYLAMAVAYAGLFVSEGAILVPPGDQLPPTSTGRGYVILIYLGFSAMAVVPVVTMLRLCWEGKKSCSPPSQG